MATAGRSTVGATASVSPWTYLLNQAPIVVRYLGLMLWPGALVLDYGIPRSVPFAEVAPSALLVVVLAAVSVMAYLRWPKIGVLAVMFFVTLAPTSSVVPILTEVGAERRMYMPSAALVVLAVVLGWQLVAWLMMRYPTRGRQIARTSTVVVAVCVAALAARTIARNHEFASPARLWQTVVDRRPHGRARYALGAALVEEGHHQEALAEFSRALTDFPDAGYALGTELAADGRLEESAAHLETFIRAHPSQPDRIPAHLLLGNVRAAQGNLKEAEDEFRTVLAAGRPVDGARQGLAAVGAAHREEAATLMRAQQTDAAHAHAEDAVRLLPQDPAAINLLGVTLAAAGNLEAAAAQFRRVLALDPANQEARNNLARALGTAPAWPTRRATSGGNNPNTQ
jgi:Flp pilus assembly protein TadD